MPLRPLVLPAIVGSALTLAVVGLMSMTQVLPAGQHVIVSYGPDPRDMVQIREGTPYVVPAGRLLVVTALGRSGVTGGYLVELKLNGMVEVCTSPQVSDPSTVSRMPIGFTASGGSTVDVVDTYSGASGLGRAWGYLANE